MQDSSLHQFDAEHPVLRRPGAPRAPRSRSRISTAAWPISYFGWWMVVSGGFTMVAKFDVVEADHRDIFGNAAPGLHQRADHAERHHVAGREHGGDSGMLLHQLPRQFRPP